MLKLQIPINNRGEVFEYMLDKERVTVGRRHDNDIRIRETYVSAYHAEFVQEGDKILVQDRSSNNGTFLNGSKVTEKIALSAGDKVKFGTLPCIIVDATPVAKERVRKLVDPKTTPRVPKDPPLQRSNERDTLSTMRSELENQRESVQTVKRDLETAKETISELEAELENQQKASSELTDQLISAKAEANESKSELTAYKKRLTDLKTESDQVRTIESSNLKAALAEAEGDRDRFEQLNEELKARLESTREGLSAFVHSVRSQHSQADSQQQISSEELSHAKQRLRELENELELQRCDLASMEADYEQRLIREKGLQEKLERDLKTSNVTVSQQRITISGLEDSLEELQADCEELRALNQAILGKSVDLAEMDGKLSACHTEIAQLELRKDQLMSETEKIGRKKRLLAEDARTISDEPVLTPEEPAVVPRVMEEDAAVLNQLASATDRLKLAERRVDHLKMLETELEKSVLRAQRSALSRRGIYNEGDEDLSAPSFSEDEHHFCSELIERVELIEDLIQQYEHRWFMPSVAEQLKILQDSFISMLRNHSIDLFEYNPGTELSADTRRRIQLITAEEYGDTKLKRPKGIEGDRSVVLQTVRPGFIYRRNGHKMILRKAEVVVA